MKRLICAAVLLALVPLMLSAGCQRVEATATAKDINKAPEDWVHRTVTVVGWITNPQPGDGASGTYELQDHSEDAVLVRTQDYPAPDELQREVVVTGEVRVDPSTQRPYIYEFPGQRGEPRGIAPYIYVLIGAGGLLILLAIVLAILLLKKPPEDVVHESPPDERLVPAPAGSDGETQEIRRPGGVADDLTREFLGGSVAVVDGPDSGQAASPLLKRITTIGRGADRDIQLTDPSVSREHARIIAKDDGSFLVLNESTRGLSVNDESVDSHTLADGDRIQLGGTVLQARVAGQAAGQAGASPSQDAGRETVVFPGVPGDGPAAQAPAAPELNAGATMQFLGGQLRVVSGPNTDGVHVLSKNVTSIGRAADNVWCLGEDDPTVSRYACEIHHSGGEFTLVAKADEAGAHKDVLVNGTPAVTQALSNGDEIQLGGTKIVLEKL